MSGPHPPVQVEIGELVLHGFPASSAGAVSEALGAELAAALAGWRPPVRAAAGDLDGGTIRVAHDASPASVGRAAAQAIRRALPTAGPQGRPSAPTAIREGRR
ncbi:MAG TPA: hypothetical protein VFW71_13860 [Actinomycetota bacterium]|nr:hypothetical protein [Actinomycetota bacterium]